MTKQADYKELIKFNSNNHKVRAWLLGTLARIEQENIINAELTETGNKTTIEILWER